MGIIYLTAVSGILSPFAWIMGKILNAIYVFTSWIGIPNLALCVILFTIVIKMLMLPLTIKQQKSTKLTSKMNPEIQKIQAKYKGKKDQASQLKMNEEMSAVYKKYGTSPTAGCLPLIISLPIMFALYRTIYAIPAYIGEIRTLYTAIVNKIMGVNGYAELLGEFISANKISVQNNLSELSVGSEAYINKLIDIVYKFTNKDWAAFMSYGGFSKIASDIKPLLEELRPINNFFGMSICDTPSSTFPSWALLIPILAGVSQWASAYFMTKSQSSSNSKKKSDNPMEQSAKTMNIVMPIMSVVICFSLPICVGIYWIISAVIGLIQSLIINRYLDKKGDDYLVEQIEEKEKERQAKNGVGEGTKMSAVAKTSTKVSGPKNLKNHETINADAVYQRSKVSYKASSIAANANLIANNKKAAAVPEVTPSAESAEVNTDQADTNDKAE